MEIWTRKRNQLGWVQWPDIAVGLLEVRGAANMQIMLLTEAPDIEIDALIAVLSIINGLAGDECDVIIASPHPSTDWLEQLKDLGVDQVWAVTPRSMGRSRRIEKVREIGRTICPHLHAKTEEKTTVSVCGLHGDRLVLGGHQLERWCLADGSNCPIKRGNSDE
jgi:hypothetical protein